MRNLRFVWLILIAAGLALPSLAAAKETETLEFSENKINANWTGHGTITLEQQPTGILLRTTGTGYILTEMSVGIIPQTGQITVSSPANAEIYFAWFPGNNTSKESYDVPIAVPAGDSIIPFSLLQNQNWQAGMRQYGLVLPPKTTLLLHRIELTQWNPFEQLLTGIRSFWTFDSFRPYSINFVWGPQLTTDPVLRDIIFDYQPPITISGTYVINGLLLLCVVIFAFLAIKLGKFPARRKALLVSNTMILILAFWAALDLRMGSEFISWFAHDYQTYISAPDGFKAFRDRDRFYDFTAFASPYLFDRQSYVFFATTMWPFLGDMRYLTYPAIPGIAFDRDDTWVIYSRPDIMVGPDNRLIMDGTPISEPGKILGRFDESSFVFRTLQKPSAGQPPATSPSK